MTLQWSGYLAVADPELCFYSYRPPEIRGGRMMTAVEGGGGSWMRRVRCESETFDSSASEDVPLTNPTRQKEHRK